MSIMTNFQIPFKNIFLQIFLIVSILSFSNDLSLSLRAQELSGLQAISDSSDTTRTRVIMSLHRAIKNFDDRISELKTRFAKLQPKKPFVIVSTFNNEIRMIQDGKTVHKGPCSTGSYVLLRAENERKWLFKTPRGRFRVTVKLKDPWWFKPDWAYVEEGLPIPSKESPKRYQPNVLGDYALGFGNGYLIHGTVYKRLLGYPVTHGCVRLDDEDMELVFNTLTHGSKIYIY